MFWVILIIILICVVASTANNSKRALVEVEQRKVKKLRSCPVCAEKVQIEAIICRFCREDLPLLTDAEREEVEENYLAEIEALDPDRRSRGSSFARKAKNKSDWRKI
ncbi:hypothetical protein [Salinivibrio kushneri]|uniref:hypothetical protein n=2 Tax=Salinivibrio TaxID=51366 RepID=UPI0022B3FA83|nr:hypothetical protein [Salinivibrio kushneri]WBA18920.1 hypothetical protein O4598_05545 [Salinivibrio kushneri]